MKKKLIAIAVAGAMAAPMAAIADVTISGQLQTQIVSQSGNAGEVLKGLHMTDGGTASDMDGGNWGALNINASEDLGGGLKAIASYGFNLNTDGNAPLTRQAFVGLSGDFGTITAGQMNFPYKTSTIGWDPMVGTFMQARFSGGMGGPNGGLLYGGEQNNTLAYHGNFNGVRVGASVRVDEGQGFDGVSGAGTANDKTSGKHAYNLSVNAPVGPVEIAVAYANYSKHGTTGVSPTITEGRDKRTATKVGVKYAAGDFTVAAQAERLGEGFGERTGAAEESGNVYFLTGSYKMGANTISASLGRTDKKLMTVGNNGTDDIGAKNIDYAAINFSHAFSSKTNVFVGYRTTRNILINNGTATVAHEDSNAFGAGLRVRF